MKIRQVKWRGQAAGKSEQLAPRKMYSLGWAQFEQASSA
jgi:hypothetical protein